MSHSDMAVNPFGEESDSVHAWKERFKQQQFQTQTLSQTLSQTRSQLEQLQHKYEEISSQFKQRDQELSETKSELLAVKEIAQEREKKLKRLEDSIQSSKINELTERNQRLSQQIEELQAAKVRGGNDMVTGLDQEISNAMIPYLLHKFDPENSKYQDAYVNLVEVLIERGDILTKIIAILIKYGGSGPFDRIKQMVNDPEFDTAIEIMEEGKILTRLNNQLVISTTKDDITNENNWQKLETPELFTELIKIAEHESPDVIAQALEIFRDTLQEREVPLTTIFFEVRKLIERIQRGKIERKDILEQTKLWKDKFESID